MKEYAELGSIGYLKVRDFTVISLTGKHISGAPGPAPVLYMFGITMEGHSVLAHIHGFLPFFYVPAQQGFKEDDCGKFKVGNVQPLFLIVFYVSPFKRKAVSMVLICLKIIKLFSCSSQLIIK